MVNCFRELKKNIAAALDKAVQDPVKELCWLSAVGNCTLLRAT